MERYDTQSVIDAYIALTGKSKKRATSEVKNVISAMQQVLLEEGHLKLRSFFNMSIVDTKERVGYNIGEGKMVNYPAGKRVRCIMCDAFKQRMNKKDGGATS